MASVSLPTVLAVVSTVATVGGAVVSAVGAEQQASSNSKLANYQAQVAENNNTIAKQNAQTAAAVGEQQAGIAEAKTKATAGAILSAEGANNITLGQGSADLVSKSNRILGEDDAATIRSNAARDAYGFQTQGVNYQAQAGLDRSQSQNALVAGDFGAASSLLGGASSLGTQYSKFKSEGIF